MASGDPARDRSTVAITVRGWMFLLLSTAIGAIAVAKGNNLLFAVYALLLGVLLATWRLGVLSSRSLEISRRLPELAFVHDPFTVRYRVSHRGRAFPLYAVKMHDRMPRVTRGGFHDEPGSEALFIAEPGGTIDTRMTVRPTQRGWLSLGPVAVVSECPPGLFRGVTLVRNEERVAVAPRRAVIGRRVLPRLLAPMDLPSPAAATQRNGEDEFAGLREFQPGDHPRRIHWKASGRVPGRRLVKEYDDSSHRRATILLDACLPSKNPRDRAVLERAICFTVALAEALGREGWSIRVVAQGAERLDTVIDHPGQLAAQLQFPLATLGPGTLPLEALWHDARIAPRERVFIVALSEEAVAPAQARLIAPSQMRMLMHYV